jgi:hypothetical protein
LRSGIAKERGKKEEIKKENGDVEKCDSGKSRRD